MIMEIILKSKIWNISNEIVKFPEGFVKNYSESIMNDMKQIQISKTFVYYEKIVLIYKKINNFAIKNIGSFMSYMNAFLENAVFGFEGKATAKLAKLMTIADMDVDFLLISKLFSLNDFNILKEDAKLLLYEPLSNCLEHVSNTVIHIKQSPCFDLIKNPMCKIFCEWHQKLISKQLSKGELLTMIR